VDWMNLAKKTVQWLNLLVHGNESSYSLKGKEFLEGLTIIHFSRNNDQRRCYAWLQASDAK